MSNEPLLSRRGLLMKLGIAFNGLVAAALGVPIARFLLSSVTRGQGNAYLDWVPLGKISDFPEGETRLATFRNPYVMPTDGKTVDTACWVRRIGGEQFQVFAVNCAHLGCPGGWFPQSGLFMSRASAGATTETAPVARGLRSAGCSSTPRRSRTESSPSRPVSCRRRVLSRRSPRRSRRAREHREDRQVAPRSPAARPLHPGGGPA